MPDWLDKKVIVVNDIEDSATGKVFCPVGSIGTVTADLPDDNVFAVYFDNIELKPPWITFEYESKNKYFELRDAND